MPWFFTTTTTSCIYTGQEEEKESKHLKRSESSRDTEEKTISKTKCWITNYNTTISYRNCCYIHNKTKQLMERGANSRPPLHWHLGHCDHVTASVSNVFAPRESNTQKTTFWFRARLCGFLGWIILRGHDLSDQGSGGLQYWYGVSTTDFAPPPCRLPERFVDLKGGKSVYLEVLWPLRE